MWFDEDVNLVVETDAFINASGTTSFSQIDNITVDVKEDPVFINLSQYYAPVQSVNGKIGFVNLSAQDIGFNSSNVVYTTGNQTVSGVKTFASRPTVNGTGVLLSGEAASLPTTIVYTTGDQTIGGYKNFNLGLQYKNSEVATLNDVNLVGSGYQNKISTGIGYAISDPRYINSIGGSGYMDALVSGYFYKKSENKYIKMGPANPYIWTEYNRQSDGKLEILYKEFENDTPMALYRSTFSFVSMGGVRPPWDPIVEWEKVFAQTPYTGVPKFYPSQNLENIINLQADKLSSTPSSTNVVQEYIVPTPYQTTIGGYGYQLTKDTNAPEASYDSWLMLRDSIYDRRYGTAIPLSAVFSQLLEFTSVVPQSSTSIGSRGAVAYDGVYIYICVNSNTWRRVAIANW
jgi:hypothetical protein